MQFSSEVTQVCCNPQNDCVFAGTLGGTIISWNYTQSKSKFKSLIIFNTAIQKLAGHLSSCSCLITERSNNPRILLSGSIDTNVKIWDIRMKSCINTFKSHNEQITCLDISPDCFTIVSGSQDGTVKLWDLKQNKMIKSLKVSSEGFPTCLQFNPSELCLVVGTSDKVIKYWELQDYSLISSTNVEKYVPQKILFENEGKFAFIGFYDCIKVYNMDDVKPKLLDIIPKQGFRDIINMKINNESRYLFVCEQLETMNSAVLSSVSLDEVNFNPNVKPSAYMPQPMSMQIEQKQIHQQQLKKGFSSEQSSNHNKPSLLAQSGLSLLGKNSNNNHEMHRLNSDTQNQFRRPPTSQSIKSFYEVPKLDNPSDLKLEDFLSENPSAIDYQEEQKMIQESLKDHNKIIYIYKQRNEILNNLLKYWQKNDLNSTINQIAQIKDQNILVDALACTFAENPQKVDTFSLDHADIVLRKCEEIMSSDKFELNLSTALKVVKNIIRSFSERIITVMKSAIAMGDDFAKLNDEQIDRRNKCESLLEKIQNISKSKGLKKLVQLSKNNNNLLAKNVMMDMEQLLRNTKGIPSLGFGNSPKKFN